MPPMAAPLPAPLPPPAMAPPAAPTPAPRAPPMAASFTTSIGVCAGADCAYLLHASMSEADGVGVAARGGTDAGAVVATWRVVPLESVGTGCGTARPFQLATT